MGFRNCSMREPVALLSLSFSWLVIVVLLFLAVPLVCLQLEIVVFPDHTHLLFLIFFVRTLSIQLSLMLSPPEPLDEI